VQIPLDGSEIELVEGFGVVERCPERIGGRCMLMKDGQVELLGPPLPIRLISGGCGRTGAARQWALADGSHRPSPQGGGRTSPARNLDRRLSSGSTTSYPLGRGACVGLIGQD